MIMIYGQSYMIGTNRVSYSWNVSYISWKVAPMPPTYQHTAGMYITLPGQSATCCCVSPASTIAITCVCLPVIGPADSTVVRALALMVFAISPCLLVIRSTGPLAPWETS